MIEVYKLAVSFLISWCLAFSVDLPQLPAMVKTRTQSKSATPKTRGPAKCSQGTSKDNKGTTTPCMGCGKNVTDSVKALQCERCISKTLPNGSWKCTNCIGMSDKLYDALVSESNTLHWFCNNCEQEALADTGSTSPITSAEIISSVENLATTMLQKMADLEKTFHQGAGSGIEAPGESYNRVTAQM